MRPRSHRRNGQTIVYLQVPKNHHSCSFICTPRSISSHTAATDTSSAIIRPRERRARLPEPFKREVKDEDNEDITLLTPRLPQRDSGAKRSIKREPAKRAILGKPLRRLERQHALRTIPGPSTAGPSHRLSSPRTDVCERPAVIDVDARDDEPPAYSSSPVPFRPRPHLLGAASSRTGHVDRYTDDEAPTNLVGGQFLRILHPVPN